ncbi:MAG: hypothetical protein IPM64_14035 [Phycisphaerales bacterium]|nr:hypothetical protein [Phycisphaerales bacterium]
MTQRSIITAALLFLTLASPLAAQTPPEDATSPPPAAPTQPEDSAQPAAPGAPITPASAEPSADPARAGPPQSAPALAPEVSGTSGGGTPRHWTAAPAGAQRTRWDAFTVPELDLPWTAWFSIVIILTLTLTSRPIGTRRSLDGFMLAAAAILLALRTEEAHLFGGLSLRGAVYLLLALIGVYWLLRGWQTLSSSAIPRPEANVTEAPLLVLAVAAIALAGGTIATEPLSRGSQDGMVGGVYLAETGRLPHGVTVGYDGRAPLLYVLHAGAIRATQSLMDLGDSSGAPRSISLPTVDVPDGMAALTWDQRARWTSVDWWEHGTLQAARLTNAVLFVLALLAVNVIGRRLHSPAMGLSLVAIFSVFAGTLDSLTRPEVMLPTALLAWATACALVSGLGGFLATFLVILAGTCTPWAWLALPALIAYCLRRGGQGVGSLLGVAASIGAITGGVLSMVEPSIPRAGGALAAAGVTPQHVADGDAERVIIERAAPQATDPDFKAPLWRFLLADESLRVTPQTIRPVPTLGEGVAAEAVSFGAIDVRDAAADALAEAYRATAGSGTPRSRLRTLLEAVWLPARPDPAVAESPWLFWTEGRAGLAVSLRRALKIIAVVAALAIAWVIYSRRLSQPQHWLGALMFITAMAQVASVSAASSGLAWLGAAAVCLFAVHSGPPAGAGPSAAAPRITVER